MEKVGINREIYIIVPKYLIAEIILGLGRLNNKK
jgi:hypothetical protein